MDRTSEYRQRLVTSNRDGGFSETVQKVRTYTARRTNIPPFVQNFLDDCGRAEPRNKHPLAVYPEVGEELADCGVPLPPLLTPLEKISARISAKAARWLPSITECTHREQNSNNRLDHAQITIASQPVNKAVLREIIECGCEQIAETKQLVAVAQALYEKAER